MAAKNIKICFVGNFGVGKTSLVKAFVDKRTGDSNVKTTLGIDFFSKTISVSGVDVRLRIWDTAGSERYRSLMHSYLRDSSIVILVYDLTNIESMNCVQNWMSDIERHSPRVVAVVGNKMDLETQGSQDVRKCVEPWMRRDWKTVFAMTTARRKEPIKKLMKKCIHLLMDDKISSESETRNHQERVAIHIEKDGQPRICCA